MTKHISESLAVALAGQVSAGLTPGEGWPERMHGSLTAIALMVRNAADLDGHGALVEDVLGLIERSEVVEHGDGITRIEARFDSDSPS